MAKQTAPTQAEIELLSAEDQAIYKKLLEASKGFYEIGESGKKSAVEADPSYRPLLGQASKAVRALMGRHKDVAASAIEAEIKRNRDNPDREKRGSSRSADRGASIAESEIQQVGTERELRKVAKNKKTFMKNFPTSTDIANAKQRVVLASQGREKVTDADGTTRVVGGTKQTATTDVPVRKGAKKTKKVTKTTPTGKAGTASPRLPIESNVVASDGSKFSAADDIAETLQTTDDINSTIPMIQKGTGFLPSRERADRRLKSEVDSGNLRIVRPGEEGHSGNSSKPEVHKDDIAKHIKLFGDKGYALIDDPKHKNADKYGRVGPGGRTPNAKDYISHILYMEGWGDTPDEELAPTNMQEGPQRDESDLPIEQRSDTPSTTDASVGMWTGTQDLVRRTATANNVLAERVKGETAAAEVLDRARRGGTVQSEIALNALNAEALSQYMLQGNEIVNPPTANPVSESLAEEGTQLSDEERTLSEKELDKVAPEDRERIRRAGALSSQFDLNALRLRAGEETRGAPAPVYKDRTFYTRRGTTTIKRVPDIDPVTGQQRTKTDSSGKAKKVWKKETQEVQTNDVTKATDETYNSVPPNSVITGNTEKGNNVAEEAIVNAEAKSDLKLLQVNKGKVLEFEKNNPELTESRVFDAQNKLEELHSTDRTNFSQEDHDDLDSQISEAEFNVKSITEARKAGLGSAGLRSESPSRIGRTSTDIGLDPLAVVAAPKGSTLQQKSTGRGKPKRTILRRPKEFVSENNIVLQEMAQDASERSMSVPAYYVQGNDYRIGSGRSNLTAGGSEALPEGIKATLGDLISNKADSMDDALDFAPSVKVDEKGELTEPGVLRKMKATAGGIIATGKTTQEVGQDIIKNSGLPAWLGVISASAVEPAARQRIAEKAAGYKPALLSRNQFDAQQVAAGKMSSERAEEHALTDEYDSIAHKEEGERLLDHVNALNERKPHVEQALRDFSELQSVRKKAQQEMHTLLNSDDPLMQHPKAVDAKTGMINPSYTRLGVLRSNATKEEKEQYRLTKLTHKREITKAGNKAMEEHIAALEAKAGLKKDIRQNPVTDAEGAPIPLELEDSINDELDINTRVDVLKALHKSIVNPISSAPKTRERGQTAYNKVGREPVGTPETHPDNFVSEEQLTVHKNELEQRKNDRQRISEQIGTAAQMGDLRENADYDAAKDEQGLNEDTIASLESHIASMVPSKFEGHYINPRAATTTTMTEDPTERVLQQGPDTPKVGESRAVRGGPAPRGFFGRNSVPKKVPVLQQKQMPVWETPPSEETVEEPVFKMQHVKRYNADGKHVGTSKLHVRDKDGNKVPELGEDGKQLTRTVPKDPGTLARHPETGDVITAPTGQEEVFATTTENVKSLGATPVSALDVLGNTFNPKTGTGEYVRVQGLPRVTEKIAPGKRREIADRANLAGFAPEDIIHMALNATGRFTPVSPSARISGLTSLQFGEVATAGDRMDKNTPVAEGTSTEREYGDVTVVGDDTTAPSRSDQRFTIPEASVDRANLAKALGINQSIVTPRSLSAQTSIGTKLNTKNTTKLDVMRGRLARQNAPQFTDLTGGRKPSAVSGPTPNYYPKPETFFEKDPTPAPMPAGYGSLVTNAVVSPEHQTAIQRNAHVLRTAPNESYARVAQSKQFAPQVMQGAINALGTLWGGASIDLEVPPAPTMSSVSGIPEASMVKDVTNPRYPSGPRMNPTGTPSAPNYKPTESEVGEMVHSTTDEGPVTNARELGRQRKQHEKLTADRNSAISTVADQLLRSRATGATIGNL